jgi:peroxiredoxin
VCNREAASVEAASARWAGSVEFIGVAWTGDEASFQGFIDKHSLTFPTISDDPGDVFLRFEVPAQPALVIVAADGTTQTFYGAVDESQLDSVLTEVAAA